MPSAASFVQVDTWDLIKFLVGLLITFMGCLFAFGKLLGGQIGKRIDEKFEAQEAARKIGSKALLDRVNQHIAKGDVTASQVTALERTFLEWKAELPLHYVRREDYVRGQTVIEAKLDALYSKLEMVQMKGASHG